jgi:hypothetical protein
MSSSSYHDYEHAPDSTEENPFTRYDRTSAPDMLDNGKYFHDPREVYPHRRYVRRNVDGNDTLVVRYPKGKVPKEPATYDGKCGRAGNGRPPRGWYRTPEGKEPEFDCTTEDHYVVAQAVPCYRLPTDSVLSTRQLWSNLDERDVYGNCIVKGGQAMSAGNSGSRQNLSDSSEAAEKRLEEARGRIRASEQRIADCEAANRAQSAENRRQSARNTEAQASPQVENQRLQRTATDRSQCNLNTAGDTSGASSTRTRPSIGPKPLRYQSTPISTYAADATGRRLSGGSIQDFGPGPSGTHGAQRAFALPSRTAGMNTVGRGTLQGSQFYGNMSADGVITRGRHLKVGNQGRVTVITQDSEHGTEVREAGGTWIQGNPDDYHTKGSELWPKNADGTLGRKIFT